MVLIDRVCIYLCALPFLNILYFFCVSNLFYPFIITIVQDAYSGTTWYDTLLLLTIYQKAKTIDTKRKLETDS